MSYETGLIIQRRPRLIRVLVWRGTDDTWAIMKPAAARKFFSDGYGPHTMQESWTDEFTDTERAADEIFRRGGLP